jgi:hypothetical protein
VQPADPIRARLALGGLLGGGSRVDRGGLEKVGEPIAAVAAGISIAEAVLYACQAEEALARADGIAASSHARDGDASASALARVRGCALALLGRVSAQESVDEACGPPASAAPAASAAGHTPQPPGEYIQ